MGIENEAQAVETKVKLWWKSWTIWINGLFAFLPVVITQAQNQLPSLQGYIPSDLYSKLFVAVVVANILLRAKTKEGISLK